MGINNSGEYTNLFRVEIIVVELKTVTRINKDNAQVLFAQLVISALLQIRIAINNRRCASNAITFITSKTTWENCQLFTRFIIHLSILSIYNSGGSSGREGRAFL